MLGADHRSPAHPAPRGALLCCATVAPSIAPPATRSWKINFEKNSPFFGRVWGFGGFFFFKPYQFSGLLHNMATRMAVPAHREDAEHHGTRQK